MHRPLRQSWAIVRIEVVIVMMTVISHQCCRAFSRCPGLIIRPTISRPVFRGAMLLAQTEKNSPASESDHTRNATSFSTVAIPQGAVSTVVRCQPPGKEPKYMLIQRGKAPHKGMWALPGGRIEFGEPAITAAKRELWEETTGWPVVDSQAQSTEIGLQWHPYPFTTSDAIAEGYHYLISQCFANYLISDDVTEWPTLEPADDAAAVDWFTSSQIEANDGRTISAGAFRVVQRAEDLYQLGLLGDDDST